MAVSAFNETDAISMPLNCPKYFKIPAVSLRVSGVKFKLLNSFSAAVNHGMLFANGCTASISADHLEW